jgi:hypothetical protein
MTASTFVTWRAHLDGPKPDSILDSSVWRFCKTDRLISSPFCAEATAKEICLVLHDRNVPGYAENPRPTI